MGVWQQNDLGIDYEYDYSASCACKDLDARDTFGDRVNCAVEDGQLILAEFVAPQRSTVDEL